MDGAARREKKRNEKQTRQNLYLSTALHCTERSPGVQGGREVHVLTAPRDAGGGTTTKKKEGEGEKRETVRKHRDERDRKERDQRQREESHRRERKTRGKRGNTPYI